MMSTTEVAGFVLALVMVVCSIKELHWSWPLAIASSVLYFFVFKGSLLYGEAGLQILFAALALWGWWQWLRKGADAQPALVIQRLSSRGWWWVLIASALLWPALALLLQHFTDSDVAWWDALPTALSLVGQVLLGRKYIDNWRVWGVVNVISVALFVHKELWLTALLYVLFTAMSVWGWRAWQRKLQMQTA
ncbi:nicotinamide riboside transporter PnuC [Limnohabitans sp. 2KL-27]|uniref:nicotinamide riboside transporter PnuC n=1 Tax=Limnohabitans sp. 2KL-27 TaxID=1100705 RepID=UPI000B0F3417|nr:nicotinamide riboside transporter PnuC [Limnohabitans sp. 2KL-27]